MFDLDNFFFSRPDKNSDYTTYQQSWPWELLLCKVLYAGDGEKDGCWFMTIGHVSYQEPVRVASPNFLFICTELYRDCCWWGIGGGCWGEDWILIQETFMFYLLISCSFLPVINVETCLQGTRLVFSGVVPTQVPLDRSKPFLLAKSLGKLLHYLVKAFSYRIRVGFWWPVWLVLGLNRGRGHLLNF